MTTRLNNSAEGQTSGTAISSGSNTGAGSGDVFAASKTATATLQFSSTQKAHGSIAYFFSYTTASETAYLQWTPPSESAQSYALRGYIWVAANPGANDQFICSLRNTAPANVMSLAISTAGKFKVIDAVGSTVYTSTTSITASTWTRFEVTATRNTTTTGVLKFKFFVGDSTTSVDTEFSTSTMNLGALDFAGVRFGRASALSSTWSYYMDDLALQTNSTAYIGPYGANTLPTVDAGANQSKAAGATVSLSATASDLDGSISSHAWTYTYSSDTVPPTLSNAAIFNPTFTAGAAGSLYILRDTVTDNSGGTSFDEVEIRVPSSGDVGPLPGDGTGDTGFTIIGGSATQGAALNDGSSSTRVESPDMSATTKARKYRLAPMTTRSDLRISTSAVVLTTSGTDTSKGRVYSGVTQIAEWSLGATTSDQTINYSLTTGEVAAITDWGEVYVEIRVTS